MDFTVGFSASKPRPNSIGSPEIEMFPWGRPSAPLSPSPLSIFLSPKQQLATHPLLLSPLLSSCHQCCYCSLSLSLIDLCRERLLTILNIEQKTNNNCQTSTRSGVGCRVCFHSSCAIPIPSPPNSELTTTLSLPSTPTHTRVSSSLSLSELKWVCCFFFFFWFFGC